MNLELGSDTGMVRDMVREFAETTLRAESERCERDGSFPAASLARAGELGLCGMVVPEEWGGAGLDTLTYSVAIEEVARVCASTAVTLSVTNSVCGYPILRFGTDAQKEKYLRPLASGRWLGGFCLTEPGCGSDPAAMTTRAVRKGDRWILNGEKAWVTNAQVGSVYLVFAVTDPARGKKGISAFIVEPGFTGFRFGKLEDKMGLRASKTGSVLLEECEVPSDNLLGAEGDGLKIPLASLESGRIGIASQAIGIAQAAFDEAVRYVTGRKAFGRPIGEFGTTQMKLADMATAIEAARLLTWKAACGRDAGMDDGGTGSSMAKLYASEMAQMVTYEAVQLHGGYGYSKEFRVERLFRDARVTTIYEGTSEIQRLVISKRLLATN